MLLFSRDKPDWVVERLADFARIDIGVRGRKPNATSQCAAPTLASVVADMIRKQRVERLIGGDPATQLAPSSASTRAATPVRKPCQSDPMQTAVSTSQEQKVRPLGDTLSRPVYNDPTSKSDVHVEPSRHGHLYDETSTTSGIVSELAPPLPPRPQYSRYKDFLGRDIQTTDDHEAIDDDYGRTALRSHMKASLKDLLTERQWPVEIEASLIAALEQRGDDTSLWIDFAIEQVRRTARDIASIESVLDSLPATLTEMYAFILLNIPSHLSILVARMLSWSVCARMPLEVLELTVVLNLADRDRNEAVELVRSAVAACGIMLTINTQNEGEEPRPEYKTVNIVHNSLVDSSSADSSPIRHDARLSRFVVYIGHTHREMAEFCIAYLELAVLTMVLFLW